LFGEIVGAAALLNDAGRMVESWWLELNHKFGGVETDEFVVMPNHLHGILVILEASIVGATLCGRPLPG